MTGIGVYIFITLVVGVGSYILGIMSHKLATERDGCRRPIIIKRIVQSTTLTNTDKEIIDALLEIATFDDGCRYPDSVLTRIARNALIKVEDEPSNDWCSDHFGKRLK